MSAGYFSGVIPECPLAVLEVVTVQAGREPLLDPAAAALARVVREGALGRLTVERADGGGVYDSPLARALEQAGFRPTPRGLRLRA